MTTDHAFVIQAVRNWVERLVVGYNLCPFAKRELVRESVRFTVSEATAEEALLTDLQIELQRLVDEPAIETTLLIHPRVLSDFMDFNAFLDLADGLLAHMKLEGVIQIATFHPDYQFAGTHPDDAENYTNRAPFPVLHLLREASLEEAIDRYPDTAEIPERNIERMDELGVERLKRLLASCSSDMS
ncbi:DUF1415 domain-containing protein [Saccharospirillum salsuginis]|uniref:DUF1415 domain-containing protein n=1 Tax=Saccharospirillum salsuginis TaxID=418750 RepID=A0A918K1S2_9GAMM|nr:DUF1415 domain-containing protein [Saccharospirillum salsuginis]GGX43517.1 hypothetical protein GCM10007392_07820 [Saccharospirillum salsuginis]